MTLSNSTEHYVTLFDHKFLAMGMALHRSLVNLKENFHLWILCMDDNVYEQLTSLSLESVSLIRLRDVESTRLLEVKKDRTAGEYCWTLTPFTAQFVFERNNAIQRVTYLDADLFFFQSPSVLLNEFTKSGKHVLITDHAYAPEYDQSSESGKYCVQFLTFRNTEEGIRVMNWWQEKCIDWCFNIIEEDRFGDQKYLDEWPRIFSSEVHVLENIRQTLAPWNIEYMYKMSGGSYTPVFYHFHGFRIVDKSKLLLFRGYRVGRLASELYNEYVKEVASAISQIKTLCGEIPTLRERCSIIDRVKRILFVPLGRIEYRSI